MNNKIEHHQSKEVWFTAPNQVEVRNTELRKPGPTEVVVSVLYSAISAGSELLLYRGEMPSDMPLDSSIDSLKTDVRYPKKYGYACVGTIIEVGAKVETSWLGREVFCFHPHASHVIASIEELIAIPEGIAMKDAVFLPNMETAVNLAQDGKPLVGERVVILGQGIVGLLLADLLSQYPLTSLTSFDKDEARREWSKQAGVSRVFAPAKLTPDELSTVSDTDLIYEVSGQPEAVNLAIELAGFSSRIVLGSWYGTKSAKVELGGVAHRNRLQFITSQVSTIGPDLTGRWDKTRRISLVWELLKKVRPSKFISHSVDIQDAPEFYKRINDGEKGILQVIFKYEDE